MMINKGDQQTIVVFGRDGQIGQALQKHLRFMGQPVIFLGRDDCDLSDELALSKTLSECQARVIINAAAYTSVDQAELEVNQAFAVNARAPAVMANHIANVPRGILVHYSSDYVFADTQTLPYTETDAAGPMDQLGIYGQSKYLAEQAIQTAFSLQQSISHELPRYYVIRSSGVYGAGNNFIKTMLRLGYQQDLIRVVNDQVGVPCSADWLAQMTQFMIDSGAESGLYHVVPEGEASWCEVAQLVMDTAMALEQCPIKKSVTILPITTLEYAASAKRPLNSRLSHQKFKQLWSSKGFNRSYPVWQDQVVAYVRQVVEAGLIHDS